MQRLEYDSNPIASIQNPPIEPELSRVQVTNHIHPIETKISFRDRQTTLFSLSESIVIASMVLLLVTLALFLSRGL